MDGNSGSTRRAVFVNANAICSIPATLHHFSRPLYPPNFRLSKSLEIKVLRRSKDMM